MGPMRMGTPIPRIPKHALQERHGWTGRSLHVHHVDHGPRAIAKDSARMVLGQSIYHANIVLKQPWYKSLPVRDLITAYCS